MASSASTSINIQLTTDSEPLYQQIGTGSAHYSHEFINDQHPPVTTPAIRSQTSIASSQTVAVGELSTTLQSSGATASPIQPSPPSRSKVASSVVSPNFFTFPFSSTSTSASSSSRTPAAAPSSSDLPPRWNYDKDPPHPTSDSKTIIIISIVGGLAILALLVSLFFLFRRCWQRKSSEGKQVTPLPSSERPVSEVETHALLGTWIPELFSARRLSPRPRVLQPLPADWGSDSDSDTAEPPSRLWLRTRSRRMLGKYKRTSTTPAATAQHDAVAAV